MIILIPDFRRSQGTAKISLKPPSIEQLIGLARALDPALTEQDFADAGRRLDHLDDQAFARYSLSTQDVARIRKRFAAWPAPDPARQRAEGGRSGR